jgi:hypothetical protein
MTTLNKESNTVKEIKAWLSPILGLLLWTIIWADLRDLKTDVKKLMKYEIILEEWSSKTVSKEVRRDLLYFKPEDFYDAERFLKRDIPS